MRSHRSLRSSALAPSFVVALLLLALTAATVAGCGFRGYGADPPRATEPSGTGAGPGDPGSDGGDIPGSEQPGKAAPPSPPAQRVTLLTVGDIFLHDTLLANAHDPKTGEYDFRPSFTHVRDAIRAADLAVGNLEEPVAGEAAGYSGYPRFNAPDALLVALQDAGFDVLTNANNHSLDRGRRGLIRTYEILDRFGFVHTGTARSAAERDRVTMVEVNGIRIAFTAYTYGTNGIPLPEPFMVNLIDEELIAADIARARRAGADLVSVSLHFGNEYEPEPSPDQERLVDAVLAAGADIVLGHHPHVLQRAELRAAGDGTPGEEGESTERDSPGRAGGGQGAAYDAPSGPGTATAAAGETPSERRPLLYKAVLFSQGNFLAGQIGEDRMTSAIFWLDIAKDPVTGRAGVTGIRYEPVYIHKGRVGGRWTWRPVPAAAAARDPARFGVPAKDVPILERAFRRAVERLEAPGVRLVTSHDMSHDTSRDGPPAAPDGAGEGGADARDGSR